MVWGFFAMRPVLMREFQELMTAIPRIFDDAQTFILGSTPIDILGVVIDPSSLRSEMNRALRESMSGFGRQAIPFVVRAISSVFHTVLFLVATFYLLLDLDKVGPAVVNYLPRRWRRDLIPLFYQMENVLGNYIRGQVILIVIQTIASWVVLTVFGVRYALILAIITGFVEIFPVIGPWTAGGIAVIVSLTQQTTLFDGNSAILAAAVAASYFVVRQLEDIFIIPNLLGKIMEMHPLVVLFALTAGGYLAGILGVLIAVPITAVIKLYLRFLHDKLMEEDRTAVEERLGDAASAGGL
jgi:predicted PurR-regulated permease PerM